MKDLPIIDPHIHLWDLDNNYYPWLSDGVKPSAFGDYTAISSSGCSCWRWKSSSSRRGG
ncbi:hypothetical protein EV129_101817 [Rhizobium azibense]|uniref:Amidohydrolase family protein n=1 Tax=Rhizobium azibense TaxID=1136135 RepID=A0A4R3SAB4_9HYPH|nr:hypothetical protein [Rhizobium azibense]TCU41526.1 hypothetical protein EV129_101817 [Rhizobium azibense]